MLGFAKYLIACDIVSEELDSLYVDSDVREIMRKKLEKHCRGIDGIEGNLVVNILAGLNLVAYPSFDEDKHRNSFEVADASMADTIVEKVIRTLKKTRPPKLYDELDFELLDYMLSRVGINLSEGDSVKTMSDIIECFYSNPKLPMVREEAVKEALIDGVKKLKIGVKKSGKVFFKKIHECESKLKCSPPLIQEGEIPKNLEPSDLILPWKNALQEQLEGLKEVKEERVTDGIRRTWYAFYIDGNLVPVAQALKSFSLKVLLYSPLVKITESIKEGIDLKLDKYEVTASPGEEISITVLIERIGEFKGEIIVKATSGELSPSKVNIDAERPSATLKWSITALSEPGTYSYEVVATNTSDEVVKKASITVIVRPRGPVAIRGIPPKGTKLSLIEIKSSGFNFKPLGVLDRKLGSTCEVEVAELELEAEIAGRKSRVSVRLNNVGLDDVKSIFPFIAQRYGISIKSMQYLMRLKPRNKKYIIAPEFDESEARDIEDSLAYYVFEEV